MTFRQVLEKYTKIAFSNSDKGYRFERLIINYLKTDPQYSAIIKEAWLWVDFPYKNSISLLDTGIDLVALTNSQEYWAIQCKFFEQDKVIDKSAVDTFLATSSREFFDEFGNKHRFTQRLWISTTNKWNAHAEQVLKNQNPPVIRINLTDLEQAPVDWEKLEQGICGQAARSQKKTIFPHVIEVKNKVLEYFKHHDRGRLIMACGTGKTITSLKIAEELTQHQGNILFLVPSIALVGQALREWTSQADKDINAICICSDPKVTKNKNFDTDNLSIIDLAYPASTDPNNILKQYQKYNNNNRMTVVFSTYQSIDVIAQVQKVLLQNGFPVFDLIVCDEAHRTCGYKEQGADESYFTKVHNNDFIQAKKRLYMTATPKLFSTDAKSKAALHDITLWSMDDEKWFGKEIHRIGFGEAVDKGLLSDYKVIILTLDEKSVPISIQNAVAIQESEIKTDDLTKLIGTINALSKQFIGNQPIFTEGDEKPMKKAIAFCGTINDSQKITQMYNTYSHQYIQALPEDKKIISLKQLQNTWTAVCPPLNATKSYNGLKKMLPITNAELLPTFAY